MGGNTGGNGVSNSGSLECPFNVVGFKDAPLPLPFGGEALGGPTGRIESSLDGRPGKRPRFGVGAIPCAF